MSSTHRYLDFKALRPGPKRKAAVKRYVQAHQAIATRAALHAGVSVTMVSKVLNGWAVSASVEAALVAEEQSVVAA